MNEKNIRPTFSGVMVKIRQVAGEEAALKILRAYGGGRLSVPVKAWENHALSQLVGLEAARKIVAAVGTGCYDIQSRRSAAPSLAQRILVTPGSVAEVARLLGTSERYVRAVRNQ